MMVWAVIVLLFSGHAVLWAWYFPRHCLDGRRVGWGERYEALWKWLLKRIGEHHER
ncbi:MAG: hypothetical protein JNL02_13730 [Saprospiraceae bacterium]|nr:hypothetical protein [Saprospiraceae bacterium]